MHSKATPLAFVYFIQAGDNPVVKIGSTIETLKKRLLVLQTANHLELRVIGAIELSGEPEARGRFWERARRQEAELHAKFSRDRIRGEWFRLTDELATYIRQASNVPGTS